MQQDTVNGEHHYAIITRDVAEALPGFVLQFVEKVSLRSVVLCLFPSVSS
jgi:hypothetical protein